MSEYRTQEPVVAFDGVTLTDDYADNRYTLPTKGMTKLTLDIDYAQGAAETGNICHFQVEASMDGTNWNVLTIDDTSTVSDITAREWNITGDASLSVILDIAYLMVRISSKESGVAANAGTMTMRAMASGL